MFKFGKLFKRRNRKNKKDLNSSGSFPVEAEGTESSMSKTGDLENQPSNLRSTLATDPAFMIPESLQALPPQVALNKETSSDILYTETKTTISSNSLLHPREDASIPILMRGNSADTSDTSPPKSPSTKPVGVAARAALWEQTFASPQSPSPVLTSGMGSARRDYWENKVQSPGSSSSASTPSPMKPRTQVRDKSAWLAQAFTPHGVGNMNGAGSDYNTPTKADAPPATVDKSGDAMEWAYDVWHRAGLLPWSPRSYQPPNAPQLQSTSPADLETGSSTSVQIGESITSDDLAEASVAAGVVAQKPIVETVESDDDDEIVVTNPFDTYVASPAEPNATTLLEDAMKDDVETSPKALHVQTQSATTEPNRPMTPLEQARKKRTIARAMAGHVLMVTTTRRKSFMKSREAPILSLFGSANASDTGSETTTSTEESGDRRTEMYHSYVAAYKDYSRERTPTNREHQLQALNRLEASKPSMPRERVTV